MAKLREASFQVSGYPKRDIPEPKVAPKDTQLSHIEKWTKAVKSFPDFHRLETENGKISAYNKAGHKLGHFDVTSPAENDAEVTGMLHSDHSNDWVDEHSDEVRDKYAELKNAKWSPDRSEMWSKESVETNGHSLAESEHTLDSIDAELRKHRRDVFNGDDEVAANAEKEIQRLHKIRATIPDPERESARVKRDDAFRFRTESTEELVNAIADKSAMRIDSSFKEAISARVLDAISDRKQEIASSMVDSQGRFQREEWVKDRTTLNETGNGAPAACPHCLKKVSGKGVYHNPPKVKIELGIDQPGFYHAKCYKEKNPDAVVESTEDESALNEMAVPWPDKAPQLKDYKKTDPGSNVWLHPDGHRFEKNPQTGELIHYPAGSTKGKKFGPNDDVHPYLMKLHQGFDDKVKQYDADASRSFGDDMRLRHKMGGVDYAYKKARKAGTLTPEDHAKMAVDYKAMHRAVMNGQARERKVARAKYDAFNSVKESAAYGTPGCKGCESDTYNGVCMDCTRARQKAATSRGGCKCGGKKVPSEVKQMGSRKWISCERCFGQISQLS